ncbi:diacylglycerol/lipid kinase family protein [Novipirellula herctigrandis]|uniref:diacylglycerol/lipid kinase family protein n=1 Tax=Novipirellula herctigrandis TaxID=2527986 RepID=UPI003AF3C532
MTINDPKQTTVILCASPKAGSGKGREQLPRLTERLSEAGFAVISTDSIETIRRQLALSELDRDRQSILVAAGGDGTISLVADLAPPQIPIVPMPLGTENLLARHYGCTADAERVFETIVHGVNHSIDAGLANGRLFLVMASCGFDAEVVRDVHLRRRGHIRRLSYMRPIYRALRKYPFPKLDIVINEDSGTFENQQAHWAMTFNLPCYGAGLNIEPRAIEDDGRLDLITFAQGTVATGLKYIAGVIFGSHLKDADVRRTRVRKLTITSQGRVPYQLDGDYVGRLPLEIEILPKRVMLRLLRHGDLQP